MTEVSDPRNVRNFWIEINVDDRKSPIACGPVRADGGFTLTIRQRHAGAIVDSIRVVGKVDLGNALVLSVEQSGVAYPNGLTIRTVR